MKPRFSHPHRPSLRPFARSLALATLGVAGLLQPRLAQAGPIELIANETGSMNYPSSAPGSVGNEFNEGFTDSHTAVQSSPLSAALSATRTGTDASGGPGGGGTTGTTTLLGATTTDAGHISALSSASAFSTADIPNLALFPHGGVTVEGFGKFSDNVIIASADYGAFVPVTIHLKLSWTYSYDLTSPDRTGVDFMQDWAIAQMGLQQVGSITLYNLVRTDDLGHPRFELEGSLSGFTYNNQSMSLFGNLDVLATAAVNVHGTVTGPSGSAAAFSSADAYFSIEAPTNATITAESGHDYTYRLVTQSVSDTASSLGLLGAGVLLLGFVRRHGAVARATVA